MTEEPCGCIEFYAQNPIPEMSLAAIVARRLALQSKLFQPGYIQILRDLDWLIYAASGNPPKED